MMKSSFLPVINPVQAQEEQLRGPEQTFQRIALSADGSRLASGAPDGTVKIWDIRSAYDPEAESLVKSLFGTSTSLTT